VKRRIGGARERRAALRAGWSLPLTWILPLGIGGLVYLVSWQASAYALALLLVIVLGTVLHDARLPRGRSRDQDVADPPRTAFRFYSQLDLLRLGDSIQAAFDTGTPTYARGLAWEFMDCESMDGELLFQLSRQYLVPASERPDLCHLLVTYQGENWRAETCDRLAHKLATALDADLRQVPKGDPY